MHMFFFFSSRRRHTRWTGDWSSDVCSSDLGKSVEQKYGLDWVDEVFFSTPIRTNEHGGSLLDSSTDVIIPDRKSTRLNSSHPSISYAVFCLKKKTNAIIYSHL